MRPSVLALLLVSCGGAQQSRDACYARAEDAAIARAEKLCPGGGDEWEACPHRQAILDSLAAEYRRCP